MGTVRDYPQYTGAIDNSRESRQEHKSQQHTPAPAATAAEMDYAEQPEGAPEHQHNEYGGKGQGNGKGTGKNSQKTQHLNAPLKLLRPMHAFKVVNWVEQWPKRRI